MNKNDFRSFIRLIVPPIFYKIIKKKKSIKFYKNWNDALSKTCGYDNALILDKVRNSLLKVKNGQAVYERDSVLFDKIQYSWPVLSALLWSASLNNNRLNLIDYGGSLGSSYFQNRKFLSHIENLKWNIIEQNNFVENGRKYFEDQKLRFYFNIDECLSENKVQLILFSSLLQYISEPYKIIDMLSDHPIDIVVVDRTSFINGNEDKITIQKVPQEIYNASYPFWVFNENKFKSAFLKYYDLITDFNNDDYLGEGICFKGFIFKRRNE